MIVAIVGPTGVGKTALSIALAKKYDAEVINFDAMQVYEKMDIGTAKVTREEMDGVVHHLLSFVPLTEKYSVFQYQKDARTLLDAMLTANKNVILVGGTGLYLKALLYDYRFEEEILSDYEALSNEEILQKIKAYDVLEPPHVNNRRRLVRLLNRLESGEERTACGNTPLYDAKIIGLTCPRDVLYERINKRVDLMMKKGLLKEAESLWNTYSSSQALRTAIGYKEFLAYFNQECSLEEVVAKIKQNSRHYAKRQFTFFRHQLPVRWYDVDFRDFRETIQEIMIDLDKERI